MKSKNPFVFLITMIFCLAGLTSLVRPDPVIALAGPVTAQNSPFDWSFPERIAERQEQTSEPELVADQSGRLHLFWSPYSATTQSLYYSQWDGNAWTEAVDIFNNSQISGPSAAVDSRGIIHLVWGNGNELQYSQAPVDEAFSARAWSPPEPVANGFLHGQILVGDNDKLYLFYPGLSSSGPHLITSDDGGYTWSQETNISFTNSPDAAADYVRAAISDDGTLHVAWTEYQLPQGWPPLGLYYAHSEDDGQTWSRPAKLAGENYNQVNLAASGKNVIHAAWNGAAGTGGRYHRWSQDGGKTWSNTFTVVPAGEGGSEGPPQIAVDALGTLHMITTFDQRVWYSAFQGQRWSEAQYVPSGDETGIPLIGTPIDARTTRHIEHPAMALNGGNQLHVTFWDERPAQQKIQYWYTTKRTSAAPQELIPFSTETAIPTQISRAESSAEPQKTATPKPVIKPDDSEIPNTNPGWPVFLAILPVILILVFVLIIRMIGINRK